MSDRARDDDDDHIATITRRLQKALAAPDLAPYRPFAREMHDDVLYQVLGRAFDAHIHYSVLREAAFNRYDSIERACRERLPFARGIVISKPPYHFTLDRHGDLHVEYTVSRLRQSVAKSDEIGDPTFAKLIRNVMRREPRHGD